FVSVDCDVARKLIITRKPNRVLVVFQTQVVEAPVYREVISFQVKHRTLQRFVVKFEGKPSKSCEASESRCRVSVSKVPFIDLPRFQNAVVPGTYPHGIKDSWIPGSSDHRGNVQDQGKEHSRVIPKDNFRLVT